SPAAGDGLGASIATGGGFALAGAPSQTVSGFASAGAVRVYDSAGALIRTLLNPALAASAKFGAAVAVVGGYAVVGAPGDDAAGANAGAAYLFNPGSAKVLRTLLNPNPNATPAPAVSRFGAVLAAAGLRAAVAAPQETVNGTANAGGVYLYDLDPA